MILKLSSEFDYDLYIEKLNVELKFAVVFKCEYRPLTLDAKTPTDELRGHMRSLSGIYKSDI